MLKSTFLAFLLLDNKNGDYMQILKKLLLFLFILIIASLLFNGNVQETKISEASEIVEIIDNGEQKQSDGYINDDIIEENNNIFVIIVKAISSFIKAIFQTILSIISKLVSTISSILYI